MTQENLLKDFIGKRVLIVGDVMLDEYIWGEVRRISPEAPVPVVEAQRRTYAPGGAANVAANVVSLGGTVLLGGLVGSDEQAERLRDVLTENGVQASGLIADAERPTTTKTRVLAHSQQIVRVDSERRTPMSARQEAILLNWIAEQIPSVGACVLSDYSKGVVTDSFAQNLFTLARNHALPVIVDPKGTEYKKYAGATVLTPNLAEVEKATGIETGDEASIQQAADFLMALLPQSALLVTRGAQGMSLFRSGSPTVHIPTVARNVYDVTGAGDTVVSALALALSANAPLEPAARLANHAAGIVVGKLGTARVTLDELRQEAANSESI